MISSLSKELEDLRSGKISKDNLALEIEEKTKELNAAQKNLELLTGQKYSPASTDDQYSQKRLDADFKLEKDRISVMEDGYAKRKALLDLQHRQNLAQIDKEEKELLEARKKANKGGLSQSDVSGFQERISLEKQNYNNNLVDLFDEEIAYRKNSTSFTTDGLKIWVNRLLIHSSQLCSKMVILSLVGKFRDSQT